MKQLAIITSHPVQYNAPMFELLASRGKIRIKVFYTWGESVLEKKFDPGFGRVIDWDIPLLKGYDFSFLENTAPDKGSHHFKGIINPVIIQTIKDFNPDAILVYGWSFVSHLKALRYFRKRVPVIFRGDSNLLDHTGFIKGIIRNLFLRYVYRNIDIALYVGKSNYDYFRKAGLRKEQLVFAPHAIENERFQCDAPGCKQAAAAIREVLSIKPTDFVFLYAGKLEAKKDPAILLEAFARCDFPVDIQLLITGNGVLESMLKEKFSHNPNIHFLDFQNQQQMPAVYEMADVFVLPSKGPGETWGLSINEAMANGKPVIVSDKCGCAADLVENGINGYIFEAGNRQDMEITLRTMVSQKSYAKMMGKRSRDKIRNFSFDHLASSIEAVVLKTSGQ